MASRLQAHQALHLKNRAPEPVPVEQLVEITAIESPTLVRRAPSSTSSSADNVCTSNDSTPNCQKPSVANNITVPVSLGVIIPVVGAIILFIFLHRRHVKRLHREDANDPHASLDFGIDPASASVANKKKGKRGDKVGPEMAVTDLSMEKSARRGRGLSMDMDMGSPYVLPADLHSSRESLHSMSRTVHGKDDKYRPATFIPNDSGSLHSYPTPRKGDDSSSYAGSTSTGQGYAHDGMNQNLLRNAQRMSRSMPPTERSPAPTTTNIPQIQVADASMQVPHKGLPPTGQNGGLAPASSEDARGSYQGKDGAAFRQSNNYLGSFIHSREASIDHADGTTSQSQRELPTRPPPVLQQTGNRKSPPPNINTAEPSPRPPRKQSLKPPPHPTYPQNLVESESTYEGFTVTPASPPQRSKDHQPGVHYHEDVPAEYGLGVEPAGLGFDVRRLSMGFRPLPPDDPTDNPEQRANRIRSFYKEYFDESKQGSARAPGDYTEDYSQEYLGDGAIFDPTSGQYIVGQPEYAKPYSRRAMTPPPRAPPRFQGASRHQATFSGSGLGTPPGPRAFSSASGRLGPSGRGPPKKALPPPAALNILPSPHLLKEDSMLPIDFAPPMNYKDRQAGRPESPRGGSRPYSPMVPAHLPLASSFDDLSVMPSPHSLRKSGTFTALDFAPPPRFKSSDTASDAGSIRSNRSAMSQQQLHSIRAGAYRISRIPKEVAGTKNELQDSLKPKWDMRA